MVSVFQFQDIKHLTLNIPPLIFNSSFFLTCALSARPPSSPPTDGFAVANFLILPSYFFLSAVTTGANTPRIHAL
jgi:hypothetical protein